MTDTHIVDANVILRYLLADHPELHARAKRFFGEVRDGKRHAFVPESVLAECVYVMQRIYQVPRAEIAEKLTRLLGYRGIGGERVPMLCHALAIYRATSLSFVDALIASCAVALQLPVETFDDGLRKYLDRGP